MVSNERSFRAPVASRRPSSLATTSRSSGSDACASVASQCRKRVRAAPSRRWARRAPSISVAFLQARGRAHGSTPVTTLASAPSRTSEYQAEDWPGSTRTRLPPSAFSAGSRSDGGCRLTPLPSQAGRSGVTLSGSRNSRAVPSASSTACPSGSGERITSPPLMLNSQAIEAGAVITAASAPASARLWATRARLEPESSPAYSRGCGTTGALGCDGRSEPQATSSGLSATGFSSPPARSAADLSLCRASGLCRRGSKPITWPGRSVLSSQAETPPSIRSFTSNRLGSTWSFTCRV